VVAVAVASTVTVASLTAGVVSTDTGSTTTSALVPGVSEETSLELEQPTAKITAIVDTKLVKFILPPLNGKEIIMSVLINYKFLQKYVIS
jgi:carbohydrate-binding DOMON domain-containing protein